MKQHVLDISYYVNETICTVQLPVNCTSSGVSSIQTIIMHSKIKISEIKKITTIKFETEWAHGTFFKVTNDNKFEMLI